MIQYIVIISEIIINVNKLFTGVLDRPGAQVHLRCAQNRIPHIPTLLSGPRPHRHRLQRLLQHVFCQDGPVQQDPVPVRVGHYDEESGCHGLHRFHLVDIHPFVGVRVFQVQVALLCLFEAQREIKISLQQALSSKSLP
jgi:hypothetical protein